MSGIVWLASYPKSGNTWMRVFLAHLLREDRASFSINDIGRHLQDGLGIASERLAFDQLSGLDASDLLPDEIDALRPLVYEAVSACATRPIFVKVHDANLPTRAGERLIPPAVTRAVIYIVRNPLDVAVSFAFHSGISFDRAIDWMGDRNFAFSSETERLPQQLRQRLSSWSGHVESWIDDPELGCHLVRYEDMTARAYETFSAAVRFLALPDAERRIRNALAAASFDRLRDEEEHRGFAEKPYKMERFFREGRVGGWRDHLTPAQAERIVANHGVTMRRLGYLDPDGRPLY
ncbi:MAG TPA: sulfotransferase domain-containing protein [Stellaceae bacterium]|nr:sulfotransferase domain-containing protein [Stellaceae bacterium]